MKNFKNVRFLLLCSFIIGWSSACTKEEILTCLYDPYGNLGTNNGNGCIPVEENGQADAINIESAEAHAIENLPTRE